MSKIDRRLLSGQVGEASKDTMIKLAAHTPRLVRRGLAEWFAQRQKRAFEGGRGPTNLFYFVTNRCNLRCSHCFYASELQKEYAELTTEEVRRVADSLADVNPTVILCGGEPFMRKDLTDILLAFALEAGIQELVITTNGFFIERLVETARTFLDEAPGILRIAVSLDGLADVHNEIRGSELAFKMADAAIREVEELSRQNKRIKPVINSVVSTTNIDSFPDFYRFVRANYPLSDFAFTFVRQDARDVHGLNSSLLWDTGVGENLMPGQDECLGLLSELRDLESRKYLFEWRLKVREYHLRLVQTGSPVVHCIAHSSYATLYPDGGVSHCEVVRPFDNVRNYGCDFMKCWTSAAADHQKEQLSHCYCTYPCALTGSMLADPRPILEVFDYRP